MRYVIIGGSAAGTQAAEDLRRLDPASEITLISKENFPPYSRCLLSRFLDGRLDEGGLYFRTGRFFDDFGINGIIGTEVIGIDRSHKGVRCGNGTSFNYDRLLVATGARPWDPALAGINLKGVHHFHGMDDAHRIIAGLRQAKSAVVVGAGFVGLEAAYALRKRGLNVTVVERCSQILPNQLDRIGSDIIFADLRESGVDIMFDQSVVSIDGKNDCVTGITLADATHLRCELLIMATGIAPNKEIAQTAGIDCAKGVVVDEYLTTSDPDIFAAGDVIEIQDISTGKRMTSATWLNAVLQGKFAACSMAGLRRRYSGGVGIQNAVQFHRVPAVSFGQTLVDAESHEDFEIMSQHQGSTYRKLVLKGDRLRGMIFVGDITKAGLFTALIRHEVDISGVRDRLLDPDFSHALFINEQRFGQLDPCESTSAVWHSTPWWAGRVQTIHPQ